jgi:hypothetical protein
MSDDPNTPPAAEDVSHFPPDMAAERLVKMSAAYNATQTKTIHDLSPEEAAQRLATMAAEFNKTKATTLPAADAAVLGDDRLPRESEVTTWPKQNIRNRLSTVETLREIGIPDEGITRILAGKGYSQQDYDAAIRWRQRAESDPELRKAILSGDRVARHVLTAMSAIIALGPPLEVK